MLLHAFCWPAVLCVLMACCFFVALLQGIWDVARKNDKREGGPEQICVYYKDTEGEGEGEISQEGEMGTHTGENSPDHVGGEISGEMDQTSHEGGQIPSHMGNEITHSNKDSAADAAKELYKYHTGLMVCAQQLCSHKADLQQCLSHLQQCADDPCTQQQLQQCAAGLLPYAQLLQQCAQRLQGSTYGLLGYTARLQQAAQQVWEDGWEQLQQRGLRLQQRAQQLQQHDQGLQAYVTALEECAAGSTTVSDLRQNAEGLLQYELVLSHCTQGLARSSAGLQGCTDQLHELYSHSTADTAGQLQGQQQPAATEGIQRFTQDPSQCAQPLQAQSSAESNTQQEGNASEHEPSVHTADHTPAPAPVPAELHRPTSESGQTAAEDTGSVDNTHESAVQRIPSGCGQAPTEEQEDQLSPQSSCELMRTTSRSCGMSDSVSSDEVSLLNSSVGDEATKSEMGHHCESEMDGSESEGDQTVSVSLSGSTLGEDAIVKVLKSPRVTKDDRVCEDTDTQKQVQAPAPKEGLRAKFKSCYKTVKGGVKACAKATASEFKSCATAIRSEVAACAETVKCEAKACAKATQCGAKACAVEVKRCLGAWLRIAL